jgi:uncharacterized membrane protein YhaH (DUF805 family)
MARTAAEFIDQLLSPKNRWSYALWVILLFNCLGDSQKYHEWTSVYYWVFRVLAAFFGLTWVMVTLSRLREFNWSLWWMIPFALPWLGLIWMFKFPRGGRSIGLAILATWFLSQSFLIFKNGRDSEAQEAVRNT